MVDVEEKVVVVVVVNDSDRVAGREAPTINSTIDQVVEKSSSRARRASSSVKRKKKRLVTAFGPDIPAGSKSLRAALGLALLVDFQI